MTTKSARQPTAQPRAKRRKALRPRATEYDAYIGQRLRTARKLAGLTQQDLAHELGVSFQAVQKYESGENRMAAPRLFKAAQVLGTNIRYFARPTDEELESEVTQPLSSEELELVRDYRCLTDEQMRMALRKLVHAMAEADTARAKRNAENSKGP